MISYESKHYATCILSGSRSNGYYNIIARGVLRWKGNMALFVPSCQVEI